MRCTDSGAGAGDRTSLDGRVREVDDLKGDEPTGGRQSYEVKPKEVDDFELKQPGAERLLEAKRITEVAGVGGSVDFEPAGRSTAPAET